MLVYLRPPCLHLFPLESHQHEHARITPSINIPRISSSDLLAVSKRLSNFDFLSCGSDGAGDERAGEEGPETLVPVSHPAEDAREAVARRRFRLIVDGS
jgi:hypothetical protein